MTGLRLKQRLRARVLLMIGCGWLLGISAAWPVDYSWTSATSGHWTNSTLWTPSGVPTNTDTATIGAVGSAYTVTYPSFTNFTLGYLNIPSSDAKFYMTTYYDVSNQKQTVLTSQGPVVNAGTMDFYANGVGFWNQNLFLNINSGALTNSGTVLARTANHYGSSVSITGDIVNQPGAAITVTKSLSGGLLYLTKPGGNYLNQGAWNVNSGGVSITGSNSVFQQSGGGSSLIVSNGATWTLGAWADLVSNTFAIAGGQLSGSFTLYRTAATLDSSVTVTGPTTFRFYGDPDSSQPINSYAGDVPPNVTLSLVPAGASEGSFVDVPGSLLNRGTISLFTDATHPGNKGYPLLTVLNSGVLTNAGTLRMTIGRSYFSDTQINKFIGNLVNLPGGVISIQATNTYVPPYGTWTTDKAGIFTSGGTFLNQGAIYLEGLSTGSSDLQSNVTMQVDGGVFTNAPTGLIRSTGTSSNATLKGTASLYNAGTIEIVATTNAATRFTVNSSLSSATSSGNSLLSGTWRVQDNGYGTTLNVVNAGAGNINALNGATVILDGPNATFTQLESAIGRLTSLSASSALSILGGKSFLATNVLVNAGLITVGTGSTLTLGVGGGGVLTNSGTVAGSGLVAGSVIIPSAGHLSPGSSPGTLSVADLTLSSGAIYDFEAYDLTVVTNQLVLNNGWVLRLLQDGRLADGPGQSVPLFTYDSTGALALTPGVDMTIDASSLGFTPSTTLSLTDLSGTIYLNGLQFIPEPGTLLLLAFGGLLLWRRKRHESAY